jgi:transcription elongation GreA/GreB family factor
MIEKEKVFEQLRALVTTDLARATQTQRETQEAATHEEARPENDKDTRALEASYLARGLAERVAVLENAAATLARAKLRVFGPDKPAALFALVTLQPEQGPESHYFIVPAAGGMRLQIDAETITTVTPDAPLGRALVGASEGDEISVQTPQGLRAMEIVRVV